MTDFKWIIRQDEECGVTLLLSNPESGIAVLVWSYSKGTFDEAKQAAIQDLAEIQKAPLEIEGTHEPELLNQEADK